MNNLEKRAEIAGRCNALKQAQQTCNRTVVLANKTKAFTLTESQEAELQAVAVILARIQDSLWDQFRALSDTGTKTA